jgi:Ribbon-helix-helix protein, copG family
MNAISTVPTPVYAMSMLTVRLQILVSPQQKRRLEAEAQTRGESVGELVREAIDARYGAEPTREERMAAVERMRAAPAIRFFTPEELMRIHEEEIEEEYPEFFPLRESS